MPMNKQKYHRLILLLLLAAICIPLLAADAENQATATSQAATTSEEPPPASPEKGAVEPGGEQAAEKAPAVTGAVPTPIKEFKPTEKIQADSAVSFPIDI